MTDNPDVAHNDGFTTVTKFKYKSSSSKKRKGKRGGASGTQGWGERPEGDVQTEPERTVDIIRDREKVMQETEWFKEWKDLCEQVLKHADSSSSPEMKTEDGGRPLPQYSISQVVSFGLGSVKDARIPQFQLVLLLDLMRRLGSSVKVSCYDPVFTARDAELLQRFGIEVMDRNDQARFTIHAMDEQPPPSPTLSSSSFYTPPASPSSSDIEEPLSHLSLSDRPAASTSTSSPFQDTSSKAPPALDEELPVTLFYMPHCGRGMYENLLRSNWDRHRLGKMILLCNDLASYGERVSDRKLEKESPCIFRLIPHLRSLPLPAAFLANDIFNDLALQWVPAEALDRLCKDGDEAAEFWQLPAESNAGLDPEMR